MAQVLLKDVSKIYTGGVAGVKNSSAEIPDKEFTVIVGPSGSGKSTLLRMIAGLEEITSGDLMIDGVRVNDLSPKDRDIAMVFQNYALYPHMSVYENMAFGLRLRRIPEAEIDRRVREAAKLLHLDELLGRKPKALSGGQRQRVAVGRSIVRQPKVFLFDEPLSNLDAKLRVEMRAEISKLHQRLEATIVYVTHDQVEAMTLADRIIVMKDAEIQQIGGPLELYERPKNRFVAGFIGSPAMNFLDVETASAEAGGGMLLRAPGLSVRVGMDMGHLIEARKSRRLTLGIRPEHIHDRLFLSNPPPDQAITATVDLVEPMGSETFVRVVIGEALLTVRLGGESIPRVGQEMDLVLEMARAHLFDAATEEAIV